MSGAGNGSIYLTLRPQALSSLRSLGKKKIPKARPLPSEAQVQGGGGQWWGPWGPFLAPPAPEWTVSGLGKNTLLRVRNGAQA